MPRLLAAGCAAAVSLFFQAYGKGSRITIITNPIQPCDTVDGEHVRPETKGNMDRCHAHLTFIFYQAYDKGSPITIITESHSAM